jgi:hydrogenase maturation protease
MDTSRPNTAGPTPTKLFIGIGNEFRGDDGVGPFLARKIAVMNVPGLKVIEQSGEGTDLMASWQGYDFVILADAVVSGQPPGTIFRFELPGDTIPGALFSKHSTHALGPFQAIELSRTLGTLPEKIVIFGIEGKNFAAGDGLAPEVTATTEMALAEIVRELGR